MFQTRSLVGALSLSLVFSVAAVRGAEGTADGAVGRTVRALLVTGGCCHDYPFQTAAFIHGMKNFATVDWTVVNAGGKGTTAAIALYDDPEWAAPYDVVVHNECFADQADPEYIRKITTAHRGGKPAVVIHCAMHSYRSAEIDDWREFLGVTSRRHDHESRYDVTPVAAGHVALKDFPATWKTPKDELYIVEKLWPRATPLAHSVSEVDGAAHPVVWVNDYHGARVFGTTFGHGNATWEDPVFIALICRGLLWAAAPADGGEPAGTR